METATGQAGARGEMDQGAPASGDAAGARAGGAARSAPRARPSAEWSPASRPLRNGFLLLCGAAAAAISSLAIAAFAPHFALLSALLLAACLGQLVGVAAAGRRALAGLAQRPDDAARCLELAALNSAIVGALAMAVDAKDQHRQGHTERVRDSALLIAERMGLSENHIEALRMAAMLHDIGKLAIPDHILSKPDKLSQEEMRKIQTHAAVGAALLESVPFPWPVIPIIRSHHEWYDGTGYPDALAGDQIPLGARILAVADVHDALLSPRPYRPPMKPEEALRLIKGLAGTQFDPWVLETFLAILESRPPQRTAVFTYNADADAVSASTRATDRSSVFLDIQQAHQELFALYEIVQTMSRSLDVQQTIDLVIRQTKRITDFATCVVFLRQDDGASIVAASASGLAADRLRGRRLPVGVGISGAVVQTGIPSGLGHLAREDLEPLLGAEALSSALAHVLSAPLLAEQAAIGALSLYRTSNRHFTEEDARLVGAIANQAAIAIANAREYEQTRQSALSDQLTGLPNARYFFTHLEQELKRAQRERTPVSLITVDLNGLKQINDSFGHQQGDRALRTVGEIFCKQVREYDTVARYAGDEFFIILPGVAKQQAVETLGRIKAAVQGTSLEMLPGRYVNLSASFGVATYPDDAQYPDTLIAAADQAMYVEKRVWRESVAADDTEEDGAPRLGGDRPMRAGR